MKMRKLAWIAIMLLGLTSVAAAQDEGIEAGGEAMPAEEGEMEATTTEASSDDSAPASEGSDKKISVGLLLGYGVSFESGNNPWGLGFGVRGGYNLDQIFLGARFAYFLGEDPVSSWELGLEAGYDVAVGDKLTVRPQVGLGIMNVTVDIPAFAGFGGASASSSELYIAPGASLLYDVSDSIYLGAEARLVLVLSDPMIKGLSLLANAGMRF